MTLAHLPVMVGEVMQYLSPRPGGTYIDATFGAGGHARELLMRAAPGGIVIGIDRDAEAVAEARRLGLHEGLILKTARFSEIGDLAREAGAEEVDGVLFDFGLSMVQLKDGTRGFSFVSDAPLDMRMDRSGGITAEDVVNTYGEKELARVLYEFADERHSRRIARAIVERRRRRRVGTCRELADIVSAAVPGRGRMHPATRTFQALRIEVNQEVEEIRAGLAAGLSVLRAGGRMVAISYHSLEDRMVKNFMREEKAAGRLRVLTAKPLRPSRGEVVENPSSRSARLRAAEAI